jgi:hypothetical protein
MMWAFSFIGFAVALAACQATTSQAVIDEEKKVVSAGAVIENAAPTYSNEDFVQCGQGWVLRIADESIVMGPAHHTLRCYIESDGLLYFELAAGALDENYHSAKVLAFLEHSSEELVDFDGSEVDSDLKPSLSLHDGRLRIECQNCFGRAKVKKK